MVGIMGSGQRTDYSKEKTGGKLTGLFMDTGDIGMLERKDYENLNLVSLLLGCLLW